MKTLIALVLSLVCALAQAQEPQMTAFTSNGLTITITANISGSIPTPVQATGMGGPIGRSQYLITNIGSNIAFVSYGSTGAIATTNCVIPTGTAQPVIPVLASSQIVVTQAPNLFWCGITSSGTSIIYITAGFGL